MSEMEDRSPLILDDSAHTPVDSCSVGKDLTIGRWHGAILFFKRFRVQIDTVDSVVTCDVFLETGL